MLKDLLLSFRFVVEERGGLLGSGGVAGTHETLTVFVESGIIANQEVVKGFGVDVFVIIVGMCKCEGMSDGIEVCNGGSRCVA